MNLKHHYWYFISALSPKFCDEIIKYAQSINDQMALTGNAKEKIYQKRYSRSKEKKRL